MIISNHLWLRNPGSQCLVMLAKYTSLLLFFYGELFQGSLILRFLLVLAVYQTSLTVCSFGKCV